MTISRLLYSNSTSLSVAKELSHRNTFGRLLSPLGNFKGFGGRVKVKHEDWIVTEVDTKGKLVRLTETHTSVPKLTRKEQKKLAVQKYFQTGFRAEASLEDLEYHLGKDAVRSMQEMAESDIESPHIFVDLESTQREMLELQGKIVFKFPHLTASRCRQDTGKFDGFESSTTYRLEIFPRPTYVELLPHLTKELLQSIFHFFHSAEADCILDFSATLIPKLLPFQYSHFRFLRFFDANGRLGIRRLDFNDQDRPYLHFILQKCGWETFELYDKLSKDLNVSSDAIAFAGVKDSFGVTSQQVSIRGVSPEDVQKVCAQMAGVRVGSFEKGLHPIRHGMLKGNHFRIRIRDVSKSAVEIMPQIPLHFINYFGSQRFRSGIAIECGRSLLKRDFRRAAQAYLDPSRYNDSHWKNILTLYNSTGDAKASLEKASSTYSDTIAYQILQRIATFGECDEIYRDAILALPQKQVLMNIQAFTSYMWNILVSQRLILSTTPVAGDFLESSNRKRAICLQENDVSKFDLENLVFPVYGTRMAEIPEVAKIYDNILQTEGIQASQFNFEDIFPKSDDRFQLSLFGWYRRIVTKPENFSYQFEKKYFPERSNVVLSFSLPSSCYASVFVDGLVGDVQ